MKKFKTVISLVLAVAMLVFLPGVSSLQASAAEPQYTTYVIRYFDEYNDWRFQISENGTWNDKAEHRELYYMYQWIKDGDAIVVEGDGSSREIKVNANLSNITYNHGKGAIIFAPSVQYVFVLRDSVGIVNGDVMSAYVYDNSIAQFNNNVGNLFLVEATEGKQTVGVAGTVGCAEFNDLQHVIARFYSFAQCSFALKEGALKTDAAYYSLTPPVAVPVPAVPAVQ